MRTATVVLFLLSISFAGAAPGADVAVQRVESELLIVNRERDVLLQRFRLAQEMRGQALPQTMAMPDALMLSAPMINYDDMVRDAASRRMQLARADAELAQLYDESVALSDLDRSLRAQLHELISLHRQ
jgi:hypothetical protein